MNRRTTAYCVLMILAVAGCDYVPSKDRLESQHAQKVEQWKHEVEAWKQRRADSLRSENGWLTLVGLEWMGKGSNRVGSSPKNEVVIRSEGVPEWLGVIVVDQMPRFEGENLVHAKVRFVPKPGGKVLHDGHPIESTIDLHSDQEEDTTVLTVGTVQFYVIERGERLAVRVKDSRSKTLRDFKGMDYYPYDPDLRIEGQVEPHERTLDIGDVTGYVQKIPSPGTFRFELGGEEHELILLDEGTDEYFVIFSDETSGLETYGAGRYLYMDVAGEDGRAVIDFNKAYNPPCVFTDYATCPLPPRQNRLPVAIRAGEKMYAGGHQSSHRGDHS